MNVTASKTRVLFAGILLVACMAIDYCDWMCYKKGVLKSVNIIVCPESDDDSYLWNSNADEDSSDIE